MANAATTVHCERRSTVEHAHLNELGPKAALFDAVSVGTKKVYIHPDRERDTYIHIYI
jgi:hypothetical protein